MLSYATQSCVFINHPLMTIYIIIPCPVVLYVYMLCTVDDVYASEDLHEVKMDYDSYSSADVDFCNSLFKYVQRESIAQSNDSNSIDGLYSSSDSMINGTYRVQPKPLSEEYV